MITELNNILTPEDAEPRHHITMQHGKVLPRLTACGIDTICSPWRRMGFWFFQCRAIARRCATTSGTAGSSISS